MAGCNVNFFYYVSFFFALVDVSRKSLGRKFILMYKKAILLNPSNEIE